MIELRNTLAAAPFHRKMVLTPPDSYHMTVFPGANDLDRMVTGWPSYVPADAPIEACTQLVGQRMAAARIKGELPLRVRLDQGRTLSDRTANTLRMVPVDSGENVKLRSIRDQISDVYGFRLKSHDAYQFHITMSYTIAPFTEEEQRAYREILRVHLKRVADAEPVLELGVPEYCTFTDIFRFDPQQLLVWS